MTLSKMALNGFIEPLRCHHPRKRMIQDVSRGDCGSADEAWMPRFRGA
jgi:hypothetical protein